MKMVICQLCAHHGAAAIGLLTGWLFDYLDYLDYFDYFDKKKG